jgi:hypothetical protein
MTGRSMPALRRASLACLLVLAALFGPAHAQQAASGQGLYDVEIIVFQHLASDSTEELWSLELSHNKGLAIPAEDESPFESAAPTHPRATDSFPALPASRLKLTAVADTLRRSRNYRPLAHFGWTQPGFPRLAAPAIPIETFVSPATGLSGSIALSRGRYLHLTLDLTFTPPDNPGQRYVLQQSRRMRSHERHYIDHPKFGVIAVVTPSTSTN